MKTKTLVSASILPQLLLILLLAMLTPSAANGSISLSQSIDRLEMPYEDSARVEIVVSWEGSPLAYRFEHPLRLQSDNLKVVSFSSTVSSSGSGINEVTTKRFRYTLSPTGPGLATIDAARIEYVKWPDSTVGVLMTDPMVVTIARPLPKVAKRSGGFTGTMLIVLIGLTLVVVGAVIYIVRKRKPTEMVRTELDGFLDGLTQLRGESGNDLKKFQTGLYKNLVSYISLRYDLNLSGRTAEAVILEFENSEATAAVKEKITSWLLQAEKEKFSPVAAVPGEVMRLESEVRSFFENMQ